MAKAAAVVVLASVAMVSAAGPAVALEGSVTGSLRSSPRGVSEPGHFDFVLFAALVLGVGLAIVVFRLSRERRAQWREIRQFRAALERMDISELVP